MTAEEELKDLRKRYAEGITRAKSEKRSTAIVLGVISVIGLSAIAFAFFQRTQAKRMEMLFDSSEAAQYILRADKAEQEAFTLRNRIQIEIERARACEKALAELQSKVKTKK